MTWAEKELFFQSKKPVRQPFFFFTVKLGTTGGSE